MGRAGCLNWASPDLWEPWEATPRATRPIYSFIPFIPIYSRRVSPISSYVPFVVIFLEDGSTGDSTIQHVVDVSASSKTATTRHGPRIRRDVAQGKPKRLPSPFPPFPHRNAIIVPNSVDCVLISSLSVSTLYRWIHPIVSLPRASTGRCSMTRAACHREKTEYPGLRPSSGQGSSVPSSWKPLQV